MNLLIGSVSAALVPAAAIVVKATVLVAIGFATSGLLERRSAMLRHIVWLATIVALLILPALTATLPAWRAPIPAPVSRLGESWNSRLIEPSVASARADGRTPNVGAIAQPTAGLNDAPASGLRGIELVAASFAAIWAIGAAAVLVLLLRGQLEMRRLVCGASPRSNAGLSGEAREVADALGIRRRVRLLQVADLPVPMTWGVARPVVLMPADARSWPSDRRRAVLLHEMAHVARLDCAIEYLLWVTAAVYWFHPAVWFAIRRLRAESERACDDVVLGGGTRAADFATHLIDVAAGVGGHHRRVALAFARSGGLEARLRHLLDADRGHGAVTTRVRVTVGIGAALVCAVIAAARPVAARASSGVWFGKPVPVDTIVFPIAPGTVIQWRGAIVPGDTVSVRASMGNIFVDSGLAGNLELTALRRIGPRGEGVDTRVAVIRSGRRVTICSIYMGDRGPIAPCEVNGDFGRGSVDENDVSFRVVIPPGVHAKLMSALGDVRVSRVRADVDAFAATGTARVESEGAASVQTYSGLVDYTAIGAPSRAPIVLRALHGGIDVHLPPGTGADVDVSSGNGSISIEPRASTAGVKATGRFRGVIGGGGRSLVATLEKGDIRIDNAIPR